MDRRAALAAGGSGWTPANLAPVAWWTADLADITITTGISQWRDRSGNGNHLSQVNPGLQPVFSAAGWNGGPTLSFDGVDDVLQATSGSIITSFGSQTSPFTALTTTQIDNIITSNVGIVAWNDTGGNSVSMFRTDNVGSGRLRYTKTNSAGTTTSPSGSINVGTGHRRLAMLSTGTLLSSYIDQTIDQSNVNVDLGVGAYVANFFRLGNGPGTGNAMGGLMTDCVILSRAATPQEVAQYYAYSLARFGV